MHSNNTSSTTQTIEEAMAGLEIELSALRSRIGRNISLAAVIGILAKHTCPDQCMSLLSNDTYSRVDAFYSERHRFLQHLVIDRLRLRLKEEGLTASLVAENQLNSGRGDLDIIVNRSCIDLKVQENTIRIELKGGGNFEISQILRYLADVYAVVVCLAGRGESFIVRKAEAGQLVESLTSTYAKKLDSLLTDSSQRIPGPWCAGCPLECEFRRPGFDHKLDLQTEFVEKIATWMPAIDEAIAHVITLIRELGKPTPPLQGGL